MGLTASSPRCADAIRRLPARRLVLPSLLLALLLYCLTATSAALALRHGYLGSFGGSGTTYPLSEPWGVAVNEATGDVYVVDRGNDRVEVFDSAGSFLFMFGKEVNATKVKEREEGDVVTEAEENICNETDVCERGHQGASRDELNEPTEITIDNSGGGPSAGDVYVINRNGDNTVQKFTAAGAYLGQLSEANGTPFSALEGIAANQSGAVWIYQDAGESERFVEFNNARANVFVPPAIKDPIGGTEPGFAVSPGGAFYLSRGSKEVAKLSSSGEFLIEDMEDSDQAWGVGVNLNSASSEYEDVYIDNQSNIAVFNTAPACTVASPCGAPPPALERITAGSRLSNGRGMAVNGATGTLYVSEDSSGAVDEFGYGSGPTAPDTEPATAITNSEATLNGTPTSGSEKISWFFTYHLGDSCVDGTTTTPGEAESAAQESTTVSNLEPSAEYTFCMSAENEFGPTQGDSESFVTDGEAPGAVTGAISELTNHSAIVHGEVNPFNAQARYGVEYSTSPTLENAETVTSPTELPAHDLGYQSVTVAVGNLLPETTYYYRIFATNGTPPNADGAVEAFTTICAPPTVTTAGAAEVTSDSARIEGSVNPGSVGPNSDALWHFEYGTSTSYGGGTAPAAPGNAGIGTSPVAVATQVEGLVSNTTYHYRLVASNVNDDPSVSPQLADGSDKMFSTLPAEPLAGQPASTSETGATLTGHVDPNGHPLEYRFEWGPTGSYGQSTSIESAGEGVAYTVAEAVLSGLTPGVTYHYRLVAIGSGGDSYSADATFTLYSKTAVEAGDVFPGGTSAPAPFTSPALLSIPSFPPAPVEPTTSATHKLTRAQKLAKALTRCKKDRRKHSRSSCDRAAHQRYGAKAKKGSHR